VKKNTQYWGFLISTGSSEAPDRQSGKMKHHLIAEIPINISAKYYQISL